MSKLYDTLKTNWQILVILSVAGIVRYWGIKFGLPNPLSRPDEQGVTAFAFGFFTGDLNPHNFHYGSFYYYLLFSLYGVYYLTGTISGKFASVSDLFWEFRLDRTNFHLINRCFSAFFGIATVYVTYKIAKRFWGRKIGLISSFFLSLAHLHVRESHFGTTDMANTFWIALSFLFIVKSYQDKRPGSYIWAGIMAGLSTSTKYIGAMLLLPIGIVHLFNLLEEKKTHFPIRKLFLDKRILLSIVALPVSFLITTPYALLDYPKFSEDFSLKMEGIDSGHLVTFENGQEHYIILDRGWWYHLRYTLFFGLGWSLLMVSLAGIFILFKENLKKAVILCCFPMLYYAFSGKGYTVFLRYATPLIPFLCITGALGTVFISDKLTKFAKRPQSNAIVSIIAILIILPSTYNIILSNNLLAQKDNRLIVAEWINKNVSEGSSIYQPGIWWGQTWLNDNSIPIVKKISLYGSEEQKKALRLPIEYLKKNNINGYEQWMYSAGNNKFVFNNKMKNTLPQYIIARSSPLKEYDMFSDNTHELLRTYYHLKKEFVVMNVDNKVNWYDRQDAFYLPFAGFKEIQRPGPNVFIFERKS